VIVYTSAFWKSLAPVNRSLPGPSLVLCQQVRVTDGSMLIRMRWQIIGPSQFLRALQSLVNGPLQEARQMPGNNDALESHHLLLTRQWTDSKPPAAIMQKIRGDNLVC